MTMRVLMSSGEVLAKLAEMEKEAAELECNWEEERPREMKRPEPA